jgi:hypothetical protein
MDLIKKADISFYGIDDELKNDINSIYDTKINSTNYGINDTYINLTTDFSTNTTLSSNIFVNSNIEKLSAVYNYENTFNLNFATGSNIKFVFSDNVEQEAQRGKIYTSTDPLKATTEFLNINRSPLVWCRFESLSTIGIDFMNNHNLTNNGATISTDIKRGVGSASFDGTSQYLEKTNAFNLNQKNFSICVWVKRTANNRNDYLFELGSGTTANTSINFGYKSTNNLTFNNNNDALDSIIAFGNDAGNWVHIAITYETSSRTAIIYRNSILVGKKTFTAEFNTNNNFIIGKSSTNFFQGLMNDFRIYDYVVTPQELNLLYNNYYEDRSYPLIKNPDGTTLNPNLWFKFDEGTATVTDSSGNGNTGYFFNGGNYNCDYENSLKGQGGSFVAFGGNQYISAPRNFSLSGKDWSFSTWVKRTGATTGTHAIVQLGGVFASLQILIFWVRQNDIFFILNDGANDISIPITTNDYYNVWIHFVLTYETSTKIFRVYRNGTLIGSKTFTAQLNLNNTTFFGLSQYGGPLTGYMDDVRIYNDKLLSLAEIVELYKGRVNVIKTISSKNFYKATDATKLLTNIIDGNNYTITPVLTSFIKNNTKKYLFKLSGSIKNLNLSDKARLIIKSIYIPNIISQSYLQSKATNNVILKMKGINSTNLFNSSGKLGNSIIFCCPLKTNIQGYGTSLNTGINSAPDLLETLYKPRINTDNNGILITNTNDNLFNYGINKDLIENGEIEFELIYDISTVFQAYQDINTYNYIPQTLSYTTDRNNLEGFNINFIIKDIDDSKDDVYEEKKFLNNINPSIPYYSYKRLI